MYIFSCSDCKTRKTSPVLFLCMQKNVWNDHFNINAIKKALFYVYFFTCWKKGERMSVSQGTKFEDRNGGIMDVQEGHGEIVKRSAGSIVRLVRSSRSRETRYMYSFARLYNVSWEGSLDCLLAYTLPLYVHLRTCECCVYVCVYIALGHCPQWSRTLAVRTTTKSRVEPEKYWHIDSIYTGYCRQKENHSSQNALWFTNLNLYMCLRLLLKVFAEWHCRIVNILLQSNH